MGSLRTLNDDAIQQAMLNGLKANFRESLKGIFQKEVDVLLEAAVEEAMASFDITLRSYVDVYHMKQVIEVVLKDKRT